MQKKLIVSLMALALPSLVAPSLVLAGDDNVSKYWTQYLESRAAGSDLIEPSKYEPDGYIPPNFSYAGFERGDVAVPSGANKNYKVFNVRDFGAIPNDKISDKAAFQRMAKAVSEHVANGTNGAVFYIPEGRYIVNGGEDNKRIDLNSRQQILNDQIIAIQGSNVLVKGDGIDKTILAMDTHLYPESEKRMWSTPYLIQVGAAKSGYETKVKSRVAKDVVRDSTFDLVVADGSKFKAGDYVEVEGIITNKDRIADAVSPYKLEVDKKGKALWGIIGKNLRKIEKHQITAVNGNTLTFDVPVAHNIVAEDKWTVTKINPAVNVGVEGLSFDGAWDGDFIHHKNAVHDSGYSFLKLMRATDSWIRDVKMTNFNQGIQVSGSFNTTVQDVELGGNPGHIAISILYGNHNMIKDVQDNAHTWHAPGLSKYSTHNVVLRSQFSPNMGLDLHGAQPMDNLFDNVAGGFVKGHWGAAVKDQPNHLKGLYLWNAENLGKANKNLYFMNSEGKYGKLIMPHLIGLHGNELEVQSQFQYMITAKQKNWADYKTFPKRDVPQAYIESNGKPVSPKSLYEAQLEYRRSLNK